MKKIQLILTFFCAAWTMNVSATNYSFDGEWSIVKPDNELFETGKANGIINIDFTTGSGSGGILTGNQNFKGSPWFARDITINSIGNDAYSGSLVWDWVGESTLVDIVWSITDNGDGSFNIITLDGNGDGIAGLPFDTGPFGSLGASMVFDGKLKIVPVPPSFLLLFSGMVTLLSYSRFKNIT